jgi:xanthine dehydrogenase small subunit
VLNGERCTVVGSPVFAPLSDFLREDRRLVGTKVVCAEGDCGACAVLVGRVVDGGICYEARDACITFVYQVDGCHVVTVEGVSKAAPAGTSGDQEDLLHPIQRALIDHYGSQCGFCTPGFVCTLTALFERSAATCGVVDESTVRRALTGNLCRCTGYLQILEAALAVDAHSVPRLARTYPESELAAELSALRQSSVELRSGDRALSMPNNLEAAVRWLSARPEATVVAGATDVGVLYNKERVDPSAVLHLGDRIPGFADVATGEEGLVMGAGARWREVLEAVREPLPELARLLELFGAPQIRNSGTVGGNVVNASPIADSLPCLIALGAELELLGPHGVRKMPLEAFFRGYKETALEPGELLTRVTMPWPREDEVLRLFKISRRRDLDISTVGAAFRLRRAENRVENARVVFAGVAATVVRAPEVERALVGAPCVGWQLDEQAVCRAAQAARDAVRPISDVRGSEEYRRVLVGNLVHKFARELRGAEEAADATLTGLPGAVVARVPIALRATSTVAGPGDFSRGARP